MIQSGFDISDLFGSGFQTVCFYNTEFSSNHFHEIFFREIDFTKNILCIIYFIRTDPTPAAIPVAAVVVVGTEK